MKHDTIRIHWMLDECYSVRMTESNYWLNAGLVLPHSLKPVLALCGLHPVTRICILTHVASGAAARR